MEGESRILASCILQFIEEHKKLVQIYQRERGQWAVYCTSPKSFIIMFSYSLAQLEGILIGWIIKFSVQMF